MTHLFCVYPSSPSRREIEALSFRAAWQLLKPWRCPLSLWHRSLAPISRTRTHNLSSNTPGTLGIFEPAVCPQIGNDISPSKLEAPSKDLYRQRRCTISLLDNETWRCAPVYSRNLGKIASIFRNIHFIEDGFVLSEREREREREREITEI